MESSTLAADLKGVTLIGYENGEAHDELVSGSSKVTRLWQKIV